MTTLNLSTTTSLFLLFLAFLPRMSAQTNSEPCAADILLQKALSDPDFRKKHETYEQGILQQFKKDALAEGGSAVVTLPVVVHIIHQNGAENISDAQVQLGIQQLNEAFANTGYYDQGSGTNTMIQFCLARRNPADLATTGITRDANALTNPTYTADDLALKNLNRWDPTQYINIWLVREICSSSTNCGVAGYAYFPSSHGSNVDGIVMEARWFGSTPGNTGVLAHEMGHYLGLYHTFQGGCANADCLLDGDRVCDTPPDNSTVWTPCNAQVNSCTTDAQSGFPSDQNDMILNFMDYTDFNCFHDFTPGQSVRMNASINTVRASLLSSKACKDPCPQPVLAAFTPANATIPVGQSLTFTNASQNASSYTWSISGVPFSNATNASYTFPVEGVFVVTLQANSAMSDICGAKTATAVIQVVCPVVADFQVSTTNPATGETVTFSNTSQNTTQFEWFIDGISQGPALTSHVFNQVGTYAVRLEASNGLCKRFKFLYIAVSDSCTNVTFQKAFGSAYNEAGSTTTVLADGQLIATGNITLPSGKTDILLLKTTSNGDVVWSKQFGRAATNESVSATVATSDGGIMLGIASDEGPNKDIGWAKFDANGNVLWQYRVPSPGNSDFLVHIRALPGGGYVVLGGISEVGSGWAAYVARLDANGNQLWASCYDLPGTEVAYDAVLLPDGGLLVAGAVHEYSLGAGVHDGFLFRLDAAGNMLWNKALGGTSNDGFNNIFPMPDGNFLIAGNTSSFSPPIIDPNYFDDGWLLKVTADGAILWSKTYRPSNLVDTRFLGMTPAAGTDFVLAANDRGALGVENAALMRVDQNGQLIWSRQYGGAGAQRLSDVSVLPGIGYVFTGYISGFGAGAQDILLIKTDENGFAGLCAEVPHQTQVLDVVPLETSGAFTALQTATPTPMNLPVQNYTIQSNQPCPTACDDPPPPCKSFQNTYGTTSDDRGIIGIEMPGGGFLFGGNTTQNSNQDLLVTRTGASGELLWSKRYGNSSLTEALFDLQAKPDGGFFISFILGNPTDAAFAVCDAAGNVQFSRRITTTTGSLTDVFYDIIATSDGGYLAAGSFSPDNNTTWAAFFLKMDASGATQWYRGWNEARTDFVTGVRELPGGGYIACGYGNSFGLGGPHDGIAYRLDASGNLLWTKAYGTASDGGFSDVVIAADGGFLFAAGLWNFGTNGQPEGGIVRTDATGNLLWTNIYRPSNNLDWEPAGLVNTPDGNVVLAGRNRPNAGDTKAYLLKIDATGQLIWSRQHGGGGLESLFDVRVLASGSLLLTGRTTSSGSGGEDFYVLKTDAQGHAGLCPETPHTTAIIPVQLTQTDGALQELAPPALQNLTLAAQPITVVKTEICAPDCDSLEICNNGLDDDGDDLIDCLDSDCDCHSCDGSETDNWYFGRQAGLHFLNEPPQVLTNGKTVTNEASAVASDPLGNLLFYTDAKTVYQRNHSAMPNGNGLFGHSSSSQTLIVPHPGNPALFYVFTPDSYDNGPQRGLSYSVVNMALNGGFGDIPVGQKNLPLTPASELVEQLSAVRHCNGTDYWVLNHRKTTNAFLAYRINPSGLNTTPVVSNTGSGGPAPNGNFDVIGQMKIAPDGLHLARALYHTNAVEVFDFDAATGIVSNPLLLKAPEFINPYGLEFSPTGRYLYATGLGNPSSLFQFDLLAGDATAIAASAVKLATFPGIYHYGQLQLAKNGKIYTTNSGPGIFTTQLGTIHRPDEAGANCLYQENGQSLTGTPGTNLNLPNFLVNYFWEPAIYFDEANLTDTLCQLPQVQTFSLKKLPCGVQSVSWQISGAGTIIGQTKETVTVRFDQPGQAILVANGLAECGEATDTLLLTVLDAPTAVLDLGPDRSVCENGVVVLDAGPDFQKYLWYDGTTEQTNTAATIPGKYWVDVWDWCENKQSDTLEITLNPVTALDLGPDQTACGGSTFTYQLPAPFTAWHWYPDDYLSCADCPTVVTSAPVNTSYIVLAQSAGGCLSADTLTIQIVGDTVLSQVNLVTCTGVPALWDGQSLLPGGPYAFAYTTASGCDSTLLVTVSELDSVQSQLQLLSCLGTPVIWNGQSLLPGGPYPFGFTAVNGCDSTVFVTVVEIDTVLNQVNLVACPGVPAVWNGQNLLPGTYPFVFPAANGCDSTVLVTVVEMDTVLNQVNLVACPGVPAVWNGQGLLPGAYPFVFPAANGCDSTVLVTVVEMDTVLNQVNLVACPGVPAVWNGLDLLPGVYPFVFPADNGCDSTILVTVVEMDTVLNQVNLVACPGVPAVWNGQDLLPGAYPFVFPAANGCDSTVLVTVVEMDTVLNQITLVACPGVPAVWNGQTLLPGGPYPFVFTTAAGCDSTVLVTVSEVDTVLVRVQLETCPGEPAVWNGQPLSPGVYPFVYPAANGCDSTVLVTVVSLTGATVDLPAVAELGLGNSIQLSPLVTGAPPLQYIWTPPDGLSCNSCAEPFASPETNMSYSLKVTDSRGCMASDSIFLRVDPACDIYLPNAFLPDDDGRNDWFYPEAAPCVRMVRVLRVYSRWGELVFERRDFAPNQEVLGWDGRYRQKDMPPGVFTWYAEFELTNGQGMLLRGDVTLVR